jgi:hypothetical protein
VSTALAMVAAMLLVSDVMFGVAISLGVATATAIAFVGVWAALPLRRRREVLAAERAAGAPGRR